MISICGKACLEYTLSWKRGNVHELTSSGTSILMISSELPELLNMCDRIVVLNEGVSTKVLNKDEFSQETIMYYATLDVKTLE